MTRYGNANHSAALGLRGATPVRLTTVGQLKMKLHSPFKGNEILAILKEEVDHPPSFFRCLLTLNAHRYLGLSKVCGVVKESGFELRNRKDPYLSIKAKGQLRAIENGTEIEIKFVEPFLYGAFRPLRGDDRQAILEFIKENLRAEEVTP